MLKHIVILLLVGLILNVIGGCSSESNNYTAKDILEEMLASAQWQIQLADAATGREKVWSGYLVEFDDQHQVELHNGESYNGNWKLLFADEIIFYDDYSTAPPNNENSLYFEDVEEKHLYLVLYFSAEYDHELNQHWRLKGFTNNWVKFEHAVSGLMLTLHKLEAEPSD